MQFFVVLCWFAVAASALEPIPCTADGFNQFIARFTKVYSGDAERSLRQTTFIDNCHAIELHNAGNDSYTQAVNEFTDRSEAELNCK
jgi:hypothetical protein